MIKYSSIKNILPIFAKACRKTILEMVISANSGHPGGSLSSIDFLSTLYLSRLIHTKENLVISNGHISPAQYSIFAELGLYDRQEVISEFRRNSSVFEGHVTRHVKGVSFGTGPLGVGFSASAGIALAKKFQSSDEKVFVTIGDGEAQEGQVFETMNIAVKQNLNNLIVFMDYNEVQLTSKLKDVLEAKPESFFKVAGFNIIKINGHNYKEIYKAISKSLKSKKPVLIVCKTVMGKGVGFMEPDGKSLVPTWHGKAPSLKDVQADLESLTLNAKEKSILDQFLNNNAKKFKQIKENEFYKLNSLNPKIKTGEPLTYPSSKAIDCRSAYGNALLDLATINKNVIALTADLEGSVKTSTLKAKYPNRHIDVGIAEQALVSISGGASLNGIVPFCSTFGAFMSSRAKDQARVNDINHTNVKMVATHCGLSVGEDGTTHQAIDDIASFSGLFNTGILEPSDANQTDFIIRYIASHFGNYYVRMGRHKFNPILNEKGELFYNKSYKFKFGKADNIRRGQDILIIASGACVKEACDAIDSLDSKKKPSLLAVSTPRIIGKDVLSAISEHKKLIIVQDHNPSGGLSEAVLSQMARNSVTAKHIIDLSVKKYELSDTQAKLYKKAKIDKNAILKAISA